MASKFLRRALFLTVASLALLSMSPESHAVDKAKALANMKKEATKAYEGGNYRRASQLFWTAWQSSPQTTGLLYNAARTAHIAGQIERAETLYRKFLALPNRSKAAVPKCEQHLNEIIDVRADTLAEAARRAATEGDNLRAAMLYEKAAKLSPRRVRYAALAKSQRALLDKSTAQGAAPSASSSLAARDPAPPGQAETQSGTSSPSSSATPAGTTSPTTQQIPVSMSDAARHRAGPGALGWTLLGFGVASGAVAVISLTEANALEAEYDDTLKVFTLQNGMISGIERWELVEESDRIGKAKTVALVSGLVSAAAISAGLWRWLTRGPEPAVSLLPRRSGAALLVHF